MMMLKTMKLSLTPTREAAIIKSSSPLDLN